MAAVVALNGELASEKMSSYKVMVVAAVEGVGGRGVLMLLMQL